MAALTLSLHSMASIWQIALAPLRAMLVISGQKNVLPLTPTAHQQSRLQSRHDALAASCSFTGRNGESDVAWAALHLGQICRYENK